MRANTGLTTDLQGSPLREESRLRTWAGHGSGAICNGCGATIREQEIEYEIEMPQGSEVPTLHFHFNCYRDWAKRR